ncbi:MAG: hypothetical protein IJK89_13440 [Clostridia bacterium]|nr:hypothetical protein [Clostridia bacterium]
MKKINKAISVLLCLVMALSFFGVAAFAEGDGETTCEHIYKDTVVPPTCADQGYTLHVCSKCGDWYKDSYTNALGHSYGEWVEVNAATCTTEGLQQRECARCHGLETKTIPIKAHVDENEDGKCDECGADMPLKFIFSPYEWLKSFIAFIKNLIQGIFA